MPFTEFHPVPAYLPLSYSCISDNFDSRKNKKHKSNSQSANTMKTLTSLSIALVLILSVSTAAFAEGSPISKSSRLNNTLNNVRSAFSGGDISETIKSLDASARGLISSPSGVKFLSKQELINHLQMFKDLEQNCELSSRIVDAGVDQTIYKIDMHYPGFTRSNLITLNLIGSGWKITHIASEFHK